MTRGSAGSSHDGQYGRKQPRDWPPTDSPAALFRGPLYKYVKRKYAEKMTHDGEIRIGTLLDFRGLENDIARGDLDEGRRNRLLYAKHASGSHPNIRRFVYTTGRVTGSFFEQDEDYEDLYVYCARRSFNVRMF